MDSQTAVDLTSEALRMVLLLAAPVLATVLLVGLGTSLLQTLTQLQDPSFSQVPKFVATAIVLSVMLPWLIQRLIEYSQTVWNGVGKSVLHG